MADYQPTAGTARTLPCNVCGKAFTFATKSKGRYPRSCSDNCKRESNRRIRRRSATKREGLRLPQPWQRRCVECGTMFAVALGATVCCGPVCGNARGKRLGDKARTRNANDRRTRKCKVCARFFVMPNPSGGARKGLCRAGVFCSIPCRSEGRRRQL